MNQEIVVQSLFMTLSQLVALFLFFNLFLKRKRAKIYSYLLITLVCWGAMYISILWNILFVFNTLFQFFCVLFFFEGTLIAKIVAPMLFMQIGTFYDFANAILLDPSAIWSSTVVDFFFFSGLLGANVLRRNRPPLMQYIGKNYFLIWLFTTINLIIFGMIILNTDLAEIMKFFFAVLILLSIFIAFYFCYQTGEIYQLQERNSLLEKQLDFQQNQLEQGRQYLQQTRKVMHDSKNHYGALEALIEEDQKEEALQKLHQLSSDYQKVKLLEFTGNFTIDSTFYSLVEQCQQADIQLEKEIQIEQQVLLDETDLSVLLSSLFDNAVNTAKKVDEQRFIRVAISAKANFFVVDLNYSKQAGLADTLNQSTLAFFEKEFEDRSESIQRIVDSYHGLYEKRNDKATYFVKLALPLKR